MLTHLNAEQAAPSRVVLLGARGFIGRILAAALQRARIATLALSSSDLDLAEESAGERLAGMLQPTDAVVLLAALTPDKGRGVPAFMANVQMAASLCAAMEKVTPAHAVYLGSDSVYPMTVGLINEASCAEPPDLYGAMHLARERMIQAATKAPLAVLRATLVYGAADTHNSYGPNRLRRMALKDGRITLFGGGEEKRDHILVDDVAELIVQTLCHRSTGTLNLATGRSVTYAELAEMIAAQFDRKIEVVGTPRQNPVTHRHFDVTALHKAFPTFAFTPLEKGLAKAHREMMEQA